MAVTYNRINFHLFKNPWLYAYGDTVSHQGHVGRRRVMSTQTYTSPHTNEKKNKK